MNLTNDDVLRLLRREKGKQTQKDFAARLGISQQHLCDILRKRRSPGPTILKYLKLETVYARQR
jgi:transcriptional regulator with XRE-family HTH domain